MADKKTIADAGCWIKKIQDSRAKGTLKI